MLRSLRILFTLSLLYITSFIVALTVMFDGIASKDTCQEIAYIARHFQELSSCSVLRVSQHAVLAFCVMDLSALMVSC